MKLPTITLAPAVEKYLRIPPRVLGPRRLAWLREHVRAFAESEAVARRIEAEKLATEAACKRPSPGLARKLAWPRP